MSIITISRGSYSHGRVIAEKVAQELGYGCVSREIVLEASEQFNVPEAKLLLAVRDAPSILDRITHQKEKYIEFIRSALLKHVQEDNVVYHGFAGHLLLQRVPGVLKVRIIAAMEDRIREVKRRDRTTTEEARYMIKVVDEQRRKWSLHLYGAEPWHAGLYDIALNTRILSVENAVDTILRAVKLPAFQTTSATKEKLRELATRGDTAGRNPSCP
jgi:cytidylate kinase